MAARERGMEEHAEADIVLFGGFRLDRRRGCLWRQDKRGALVPVAIGARALDVLGLLIDQHGDLVSRDEIMNAVWPGTVVEGANVTVQVAALRRVLDDGRSDESLIQTIPGRGYRFVAPVVRAEHGTSVQTIISGGATGRPALYRADDDISPSEPVSDPRLARILPAGSRRRRCVFAAMASAAAALLFGAMGWWFWPTTSPSSAPSATAAAASITRPPNVPRLSFVVLPFANLSSDPEQDYFADGITHDLTTDLSRIPDSFVIAGTTAFTYKGKSIDVRQIGRELGVRYVLEGSVWRAADKVQVNAQLIDAENAAHLWADRFDTDRASLAQAQSEITGRLALALGRELLRDADRRIEQEGAADPDARDLVMRGVALQSRPNSAANRQQAQHYFERALERDPQSVLAKLAVAGNLVWTVNDLWSSSAEQDKLRAERLLAEVFERDPNISMLHQVLGELRRSQNRLTESRIELETAVALNRNNVPALRNLGVTLTALGQPEAAIPYIEKAIVLDPRGANFNVSYLSLGRCHLLLGHVNEAIEFLSKSRAANPQYGFTHLWLAGAFGLRGDLDEARAALAEGMKLKPEINSMARWGAYASWVTNPQYSSLRAKTVDIGLRRAGMPEE
jgi:adenylate cyclase